MTDAGSATTQAGVEGGGAPAVAGTGPLSGSGGGSEGCPGDRPCIPMIPKGWQGPVAGHDTSLGGAVPVCGGGFGRPGPRLSGELEAGEHSCSCRCERPAQLFCGEATFDFFSDDSCAGDPTGSMSLWPNGPAPNACSAKQKTSLPAAYGSVRVRSVSIVDDGVESCSAVFEPRIDEPAWTQTLTSCELTTSPVSCAPGVLCLNERPELAFNLGVCIYREGEHACPEGGYSRRLVRFRSFVDDRDCTDCSCGAPSGACSFQLELTASDQEHCQGEAILDEVDVCRSLSVAASAPVILYSYSGSVSPEAGCSPVGAQAVGGVAPADAVTFCCESSR